MADDPFEELLSIENGFYQEGYAAGIEDSKYAGMIEGKVFGIEKGYEKALDLARSHGRALVWQQQLTSNDKKTSTKIFVDDDTVQSLIQDIKDGLGSFPDNQRLHKHVEFLISISDAKGLPAENSDDAVSQFDDRITKTKARAKIIANIVGETLVQLHSINAGIEDATGLNART